MAVSMLLSVVSESEDDCQLTKSSNVSMPWVALTLLIQASSTLANFMHDRRPPSEAEVSILVTDAMADELKSTRLSAGRTRSQS